MVLWYGICAGMLNPLLVQQKQAIRILRETRYCEAFRQERVLQEFIFSGVHSHTQKFIKSTDIREYGTRNRASLE